MTVASDARWILGITTDPSWRDLVGVVLSSHGHGTRLSASLVASGRRPLPPQLAADFGRRPSLATIARLTEQAIELVLELLAPLPQQRDQILAIGLHRLGWWTDDLYSGRLGRSYHSCCEVSRVAAMTGMNVIDGFAASDLAAGGPGAPIEAAGVWLLLRQQQLPGDRIRALLERTNRTARLWLVPGQWRRQLPPLCWRQFQCDSTGWQPVAWTESPETDGPSTEVSQPSPDRVAGVSGQLIQRLARCVVGYLRNEIPRVTPVREIVVADPSGGSALAEALESEDAQLETSQLDRLGWPDATVLRAAAVATTALLTIDGLAVNPGHLLGAAHPRLMGQFTPGTGAQWRRLMAEISARHTSLMPLRQAV